MLCGKIIITNENREDIQIFLDSIKKRKAFFGLSESDGAFVIKLNADDEALYEVSCDLAEYIAKTQITRDIRRHIEKQYTCFNGDEKERILSACLNSGEIGELPGRIYIFLKSENSINPDGFYKFMCTDISESVSAATDGEAERLISLNDTEDFIQLLKYFAALSPLVTERVDIIAKKYSIRVINSDPTGNYNAEFASLDPMPEDILSELVALNPQKIVVHGREFYDKSEFSVIINGVFGDRVVYCEGCFLCPEYE